MGIFDLGAPLISCFPDRGTSSSQPYCLTDFVTQRFPNPGKADFGGSPSQISYGGACNRFSAGELRRRGVRPKYGDKASVVKTSWYAEQVSTIVRRRHTPHLTSAWPPISGLLYTNTHPGSALSKAILDSRKLSSSVFFIRLIEDLLEVHHRLIVLLAISANARTLRKTSGLAIRMQEWRVSSSRHSRRAKSRIYCRLLCTKAAKQVLIKSSPADIRLVVLVSESYQVVLRPQYRLCCEHYASCAAANGLFPIIPDPKHYPALTLEFGRRDDGNLQTQEQPLHLHSHSSVCVSYSPP